MSEPGEQLAGFQWTSPTPVGFHKAFHADVYIYVYIVVDISLFVYVYIDTYAPICNSIQVVLIKTVRHATNPPVVRKFSWCMRHEPCGLSSFMYAWECVCITHDCACVSLTSVGVYNPHSGNFFEVVYIYMFVYVYIYIYIYVYMYIYILECVCITHTPGISISDLAIVLGPSCISFSTNIKEVCPPCDRPMPELPPMDEPPGWISDAE